MNTNKDMAKARRAQRGICQAAMRVHSRPLAVSGRRAFTLIELILVMALMSIVIALIAPSLSNFFRSRTLDSEARRFVSLTRYVQSRAVSEGIPMMVWI